MKKTTKTMAEVEKPVPLYEALQMFEKELVWAADKWSTMAPSQMITAMTTCWERLTELSFRIERARAKGKRGVSVQLWDTKLASWVELYNKWAQEATMAGHTVSKRKITVAGVLDPAAALVALENEEEGGGKVEGAGAGGGKLGEDPPRCEEPFVPPPTPSPTGGRVEPRTSTSIRPGQSQGPSSTATVASAVLRSVKKTSDVQKIMKRLDTKLTEVYEEVKIESNTEKLNKLAVRLSNTNQLFSELAEMDVENDADAADFSEVELDLRTTMMTVEKFIEEKMPQPPSGSKSRSGSSSSSATSLRSKKANKPSVAEAEFQAAELTVIEVLDNGEEELVRAREKLKAEKELREIREKELKLQTELAEVRMMAGQEERRRKEVESQLKTVQAGEGSRPRAWSSPDFSQPPPPVLSRAPPNEARWRPLFPGGEEQGRRRRVDFEEFDRMASTSPIRAGSVGGRSQRAERRKDHERTCYSILQGAIGEEAEDPSSEEEEVFERESARRRFPEYSSTSLMRDAASAIPRFAEGISSYINWLSAVKLYDDYCPARVSPQLKFNTVLKTLDGQAKRIATAVSSTGGNPFEKVLKAFQKEYADRDQIIMKQREAVRLQKNWPSKYDQQRDWLIIMDGVKASFRVFRMDIDQETSLYFCLLAKLDEALRMQWVKRCRKKGLTACWSNLLLYLEEQSDLVRQCELEASAAASVMGTGKTIGTASGVGRGRGKSKESVGYHFTTGEMEPTGKEEETSENEEASVQMMTGSTKQQKSEEKAKNAGEGATAVRRGFLEECPCCKGKYHSLAECSEFPKLEVTKRMELAISYRFCTCCLQKHSGKCRSGKPCPEENCKYYHHKLLHGSDFAQAIETAAEYRKKIAEAERAGKAIPMFFTAGVLWDQSAGTSCELVRATATSAQLDGRPVAEVSKITKVETDSMADVSGEAAKGVVMLRKDVWSKTTLGGDVELEVRPDIRLLRVARVMARSRKDPNRIECFSVLIDSGANMSVVDERVGKKLGLAMRFRSQDSFGFHGLKKIQAAVVDMEVSVDGENWWHLERMSTTPKLELPSTELRWKEWLAGYEEFAEVFPFIQDQQYGDVRMILGLDKEFVDGKKFTYPEEGSLIQSKDGRFQVHKCGLGWVATGKMTADPSVHLMSILLTSGEAPKPFDELMAEEELVLDTRELTNKFCQFQTLEDLGVFPAKGIFSPQEEQETERMRRTVTVQEGRVTVPMLWKLPRRRMPPSEVQARRRLAVLWKKLNQNEVLKEHYVRSIHQDLAKGYIRRLEPTEVEEWKDEMWVLPHFPVYHPDKPQKVRRVCDAAAKNFGVSLNSELEQGPNNISNLIGVLMRFRQGRVAVQGDVGEMFNRIGVAKEDEKRLVFLWQEEAGSEVCYYCYTCHIFGARCAPAVANFVIGYILEKEDVPNANGQRRRFYMDDYFLEGDEVEAVAAEAEKVTQAMANNGMMLGKWVSNDEVVLQRLEKKSLLVSGKSAVNAVPETPAMGKLELENKDQVFPSKNKILGVQWDVEEDCLSFSTRAMDKVPKTAAEVLSMLASIFDPLGIVAPCVLRGKLLMRAVWNDKKAWHVDVSEDVLENWKAWTEGIKKIAGLKISRWYGTERTTVVHLHVFGDASEKGYGCVSYLVFLVEGRWHSAFVNSKSRLSAEPGHNSAISEAEPIARVELQACLLSFRQAAVILEELDLKIIKVFIWTDSQVVYWWTRNHRTRYQPFVRSRLKEIYEMRYKNGRMVGVPTQVLYVPTDLNPADLVSRGPEEGEFEEKFRFWTEGPEFLRKDEDTWPDQPQKDRQADKLPEDPVEMVLMSQYVEAEESGTWDGFLSARLHSLDVTPDELKIEGMKVIRGVQEEEFSKELKHLKEKVAKGTSWLPKFSNQLKGRRLFLDEDGIMRLESRAELIDQELWDYDQRYPIVLPNRHPVSDLLMRTVHVEMIHAGGETTWGRVNRRFYIPGGRKRCIQLVRSCQHCNKVEPKTSRPATAALHRSRLNVKKPAWTDTGIDFFGPIGCLAEGKQVKRYGLIFIDMTSRAIHLEMTVSLELDGLMLGLERFRCVRGTARVFRCDNGTTFHGADNEFRRLETDILVKLARTAKYKWGTKFEFNPPYAPHWGGSWERLIKEVKRCMLRSLEQPDRKYKTEEVVRTMLSEAMWVLNNRPLCVIEENRVLTPAMLINPAGSDGCGYPLECTRLQQVKAMEKCIANFWSHFSTGYLGLLRNSARQGTDGGARQFKIGQAVVVKEGRPELGKWTAGTVAKAVESSDGKVRSVMVTTKEGEIWRDVSFISPCEDEALGVC